MRVPITEAKKLTGERERHDAHFCNQVLASDARKVKALLATANLALNSCTAIAFCTYTDAARHKDTGSARGHPS